MNHGPGGIVLPRQLTISAQHHNPEGLGSASSVGLVVENGGNPTVIAVGGFTQLEALAVALAPLAMKLEIDGEGTMREDVIQLAGRTAAEWAREMMTGIKKELAK